MSSNRNGHGPDESGLGKLPRPPSFRHGTPSGPWPWLDLSDPDKFQPRAPPIRPPADCHNEWAGYPQAQFANWTQFQQEKSGIASLVGRNTNSPPTQTPCSVYKVNICENGTFNDDSPPSKVLSDDQRSAEEFWDYLKEPPSPEVRVRAFFVDQLSGPVLQMLGTKFHIEPFFFSSSLNLIPTQYQEQVQGDHITITLQFIRPIATHSSKYRANPGINIQGPLELKSEPDKVLLPDFLAFHIVRRNANTKSPKTTPVTPNRTSPRYESTNGSILDQQSSGPSSVGDRGDVSTIISYHRPESYIMTTAQRLHDRLLAAGHSVYWSHIYKNTTPSGDPNFIALTLLWYALYSWDEVYELLFSEVTLLESETLSTIPSEDNPNEDGHSEISKFSHKLHVIRAHLLHHESLLNDFRKRVIFLRDARHPAYTGKTGFAENTIYGSGKATKRRYSARTGGIGPLGPLASSPSSNRRRSSASEQERERESRSGQALRSLAIPTLNPSGDRILSTGDSIYEEPESDDDFEMQEILRKAKTDEGFREMLLIKECANLIHEIDRVERSRDMLDRRLANLVGFAFSSINIEDSKRMRTLAERSGRDSAIMKQISYLTMFFLPASVVATVLGMSAISEIDHKALIAFFAASLPLTGAIWFLVQYDPTNRLNIELLRTKLPTLFVSVAMGISKYRNKWNNRNMESRLDRMERGLNTDQCESA